MYQNVGVVSANFKEVTLFEDYYRTIFLTDYYASASLNTPSFILDNDKRWESRHYINNSQKA